MEEEEICVYSLSTKDEVDTKWLEKKDEKHKVWKGLFLFYLACFFLNMGVNSSSAASFYYTSNDKHIDGWSNVVTAAVRCFVTFAVDTLVKKLSLKYMMFYGILFQLFYVMADFYPCWETKMIAALFTGTGGAMMDLAALVYLSKLAIYYARNSKRDVYNQLVRYFTVYFVLRCFTFLLAQFISLEALGNDHTTLTPASNASSQCENNFCPHTSIWKAEPPTTDRRSMWIYSFACLNLLVAAVFIWLLEPLSIFRISETEDAGFVIRFGVKTPEALQKLKSTLHYLVIPINIFAVTSTPFFFIDILQGFVICPFGLSQTTTVVSIYCLTYTLSGLVLGWLTTFKYRLQLPFGIIVKLVITIIIALKGDLINSMDSVLILSAAWAVADGTLAPGITAFYAETFADRLLLSMVARQFWTSVGLLAVYLFDLLLCMDVKIYIQMGLAIVSIVHYPIMEFAVRYRNLERFSSYNTYGFNTGMNYHKFKCGDLCL